MKRFFFFIICSFSLIAIRADVVAEAQDLIDEGKYSEAINFLESEAKKSSNSKIAGTLNEMLGECYFELKDYPSARQCFETAGKKGVADAYRYLGKLDYLNYDFDGASENYAKYRQLKTKAKKALDPVAENEERLITTAENFLERVEKIAIIDSITVNKENFLKAFKLPASAGSLNGPEVVPFEENKTKAEMAYLNESGDFIIWAQTNDSTGCLDLFESTRLTDGKWQNPVLEIENFEGTGNLNYPFMMPDGVTLYFANDGDDSLGGYDIFVATRDASTGEYMQPQNLGMPYNSPFDDYMLAIDEENGIGWWATDRNRLENLITVYVFVPNEIRRNYNPDDEDVVSFARIDNIKETQDKDYSDKLNIISRIKPSKKSGEADFYFPVRNGVVYTSLNDFKNREARKAMATYLAFEKTYNANLAALKNLRKQYSSNHNPSLASKILSLEKQAEEDLIRLRSLKNEVYKLEK